jgi:arylsulfatase A-like enzyme
MRSVQKWLALLGLVLLCHQTPAAAAGKAARVVVVVWDGMRPDFVTPENTPALCELARDGVTFLHHHPVYVSSTEVNATALATGVYPGQSGIIGNNDFRPAIDAGKPIENDALAAVRKGDQVLPRHYIEYPTVPEILRAGGWRTVVAGSKPVALLFDRAPRAPGGLDPNVFAGETLPDDLKEKLYSALGRFPPAGADKMQQDQWTTSALTGQLWKEGLPTYSLLWLAEPDFSQHRAAPGSPAALAAIRNSDRQLARVLDALKEKNLRETADVFVVSDHGFSTISENVDVAATLNSNGFRAYRAVPSDGAREGDVMVVCNWGAVFCYMSAPDQPRIERLVQCLQAQPYVGVLFSRTPVEGTFPLADARLDCGAPPDVVAVMRWKPEANRYGAPGLIFSDTKSYLAGGGMHATLSATDMHNICFAAGPDFARGMRDPLPTGNTDIAPTILWLLGVESKEKMSGRVLTEALSVAGPPIDSVQSHHKEASWQGAGFVWRQHLDWSTVNGVIYLDQGNGGQETSGPP